MSSKEAESWPVLLITTILPYEVSQLGLVVSQLAPTTGVTKAFAVLFSLILLQKGAKLADTFLCSFLLGNWRARVDVIKIEPGLDCLIYREAREQSFEHEKDFPSFCCSAGRSSTRPEFFVFRAADCH